MPLEAVFHKFSSLLLISFDPIVRFRSNFFQARSNLKRHSPKMFLGLQIIAVVHHEPENLNFWASGIRKMG